MTEEALRAFRGAVRAKPDYAAAHRDLGALLLVLGERDAGAAELRLALQLDPHDREAARLMEKAER
jgi:Flp pilus assembly protein TadD